MQRISHPEQSVAAAKRIICELIAAAGGVFCGTVRLNKAFYFAHLYYWRDEGDVLTDYPIVRLPNGPCIDDYDILLEQLAAEGRISISTRPLGPYTETVYQLTSGQRFNHEGPPAAAILRAVEFVDSHSAVELSDITHEYSRSWQETPNGKEMNIYTDLLSDEEIWELKARTAQVTDEETRVEQAWAEEVRRRVGLLRAGKAKTRPIDDVLDEVDELLR